MLVGETTQRAGLVVFHCPSDHGERKIPQTLPARGQVVPSSFF